MKINHWEDRSMQILHPVSADFIYPKIRLTRQVAQWTFWMNNENCFINISIYPYMLFRRHYPVQVLTSCPWSFFFINLAC